MLKGWKLFSARKQQKEKQQVAVVIMSNNNASNNLIVAQRAVKQLRLEASIRRIKVRTSRRRHTNTEERGDTRLNGGQQRHRANFVVFKKFLKSFAFPFSTGEKLARLCLCRVSTFHSVVESAAYFFLSVSVSACVDRKYLAGFSGNKSEPYRYCC